MGHIPLLGATAASHSEKRGAVLNVLMDWKKQHVSTQKKAAKRFVRMKREWEAAASKRAKAGHKGKRKGRDSLEEAAPAPQTGSTPRGSNGYVRSEAEFQSIMSMLQGGDKHATAPSMTTLQPAAHRLPVYIDTNGLVNKFGDRDCVAELAERAKINPWTDDEKSTFMDKFAQYEKHLDRFFKVKASLPHKSYGDVVQYYYKNKKKPEWKREVSKKRPSKKHASAGAATAHL